MGNPFEEAAKLVAEIGGVMEFDRRYPGRNFISRFLIPDRMILFRACVQMDDGSIRPFDCYRVQHNRALGPYKGGIRYHPRVDLDEVKALALWMSLKTSLAGLPYGGAKGGVTVSPETLSPAERERLTRKYALGLKNDIGPDLDIPAPDVNTGEREMAWIVDEFRKSHADAAPAVTGKPLILGGSLGRAAATGNGVVFAMLEAMEDLKLKTPRVAVQGSGNVGSKAILACAKRGIPVVACEDVTGAVQNPDGLDPQALVAHVAATGGVKGFGGGRKLDDFLGVDCDILLPCALEGAITKDSAPRVKARLVVEGANGPTTLDADRIFLDKGVTVVPDILANAGGVVVSYFEWVQNRTGLAWEESEVNDRLLQRVTRAYADVRTCAGEKKLPLRKAAYCLALDRIAQASAAIGAQ